VAAGAESIVVVSGCVCKGFFFAKYTTQALIEAATHLNNQAFGKMIVAGRVNAGSIDGQSGEVVFSF
jgi:hypothetical protein